MHTLLAALLAPPSNDMTKEALKRAVLQDFTSSYNIVAKFRFDIAYVHAIHLGRTCSRQPLLAVHQYHFGLAFALACLGTLQNCQKNMPAGPALFKAFHQSNLSVLSLLPPHFWSRWILKWANHSIFFGAMSSLFWLAISFDEPIWVWQKMGIRLWLCLLAGRLSSEGVRLNLDVGWLLLWHKPYNTVRFTMSSLPAEPSKLLWGCMISVVISEGGQASVCRCFQHSSSLTCFDLCPPWGSSEEAECLTCSCLGVIFLPAGYFAPIGFQSSTENIRFCPGICVGIVGGIHVKPSPGFSIGVKSDTPTCIVICKFDGLSCFWWDGSLLPTIEPFGIPPSGLSLSPKHDFSEKRPEVK